MKRCSKCGKEADSKFCPDCGTEMTEIVAAEPAAEPATEPAAEPAAKPEDKAGMGSNNSEPIKYTYAASDNPTKDNFRNASYEIPGAKREGVSYKTWFVILFLIIFWPVGLYLMWSRKKFPMVARIIITVIIGLSILINIFVTVGMLVSSTLAPTAPTQATTEYSESTDATEPYTSTPEVSDDSQAALSKAQNYSDTMHMSKARIYNMMTTGSLTRFTKEAAQYAVDNIDADFNQNALVKARSYQENMDMSPEQIRTQLTSEYGELFTEKEADYAIQHLND